MCKKPSSLKCPYWIYLAELQTICKQYWERIFNLEGDKFDLERGSALKKMEVKRLSEKTQSHTNNTKQKFTKTRTKKMREFQQKWPLIGFEWLISFFWHSFFFSFYFCGIRAETKSKSHTQVHCSTTQSLPHPHFLSFI